jgi:trk system potassium uptake protein TrkH
MRPHVILRYVGLVLLLNSVFLLISGIISAVKGDSGQFPLFYSFTISALFGAFPLIFVPSTSDISNQEGFTIVVASWLLSCMVGVLPYVLWGGEFTFTNAWFESVSGYTTTGSSILTSIESLPAGLLFWRSATQWIGGIGIIIFVLSVLPATERAGITLYRTEMSSLATDTFHYRTKKTLKVLLYVYIALTLLETVFLLACGMNLFDSVTHSFATIATGGFSPKNSSIAHYQSLSIEIVVMVFMVLSGIHFGLLFFAVSGKVSKIWKSSIVRYYIAALLAGTLLSAINLHGKQYAHFADAFRYAAFQIISLGTSTGFSTTDTSVWPSFCVLIMIFFTLQCACAGSTSGGIKVDRIVMSWKLLGKTIQKMKHPRAVVVPKLDGAAIDDEALESSVLYICLYVATVFCSSLILTWLGVDGLSAFSAAATTMGNVGPGFGVVGSMDNFSHIPEAGKWILSANMLLGRIEIFGVVLFFTARSWK